VGIAMAMSDFKNKYRRWKSTSFPVRRTGFIPICACVFLVAFWTPHKAGGSTTTSDHLDTLLTMSLEELMQVEVSVASRRPVKMEYVAENVAIVTAEEIKAMNAHNVNEILRTVPGIFWASHENFGGSGDLSIQGSEFDSIVILLDGIRLNDPDNGYPTTFGIPVQIIERIEIVKGPATSAWGSAIGGVINFITKNPGNTLRPSGTLYGSYGQAQSQDYRVDAAGKVKNIGYYLYGGYQTSDGLRDSKSFNNRNLYAKIGSQISENISLTLTSGSMKPDVEYFVEPKWDQIGWIKRDDRFVTGSLDAAITDNLQLNADLHYLRLDYSIPNYVYGAGLYGPAGELFYDYQSDTDSYGGTVKLIWEKKNHTLLSGIDYDYAEVQRLVQYGPYWQSFSLPPEIDQGTGDVGSSAIFVNDTITWSQLSITPGIRYDHLSIASDYSDDFFNPSLGMTYRLSDRNLIRATVARGSRAPSISLVDPAALWIVNPDLEPEDIWSFQAGLESTRFYNVYFEADAFYHQISNSWQYDDDAGFYINSGDETRKGFELTASAELLKNLIGSLGFTYVRIEPPIPDNAGELYSLIAKIDYTHKLLGDFLVIGRFVSWDYAETYADNLMDDDMILDFHYNKDVYTHEPTGTVVNFFVSIHNLFDGSQYWDESYKNPGRWAEAGLRITF